MALEDWERISNKNYGITGIIFKNKKLYPTNHLIIIHYKPKNIFYTKDYPYVFEDNKDMSTIRPFKKESQALSYAYKYMKNH